MKGEPRQARGAARTLRTALAWTVGGLGVIDIAVAVVLSAGLAVAVSGLVPGTKHGGAAAGLAAVALTLPVAWRRPAPVAAAGVLAAGAIMNALLFPPMVRCGAALPAVFLVAFSVGAQWDRTPYDRTLGGRTLRDRAWCVAGFALCVVDVIAEGMSDPQIEAQGLGTVLPVLIAFGAAGLLLGARAQATEALRLRSAELRRQREQTARVAVLADRARISAGLEDELHARIGEITAAAAAGLGQVDVDLTAARSALATVERDGREVLGLLRRTLGALAGGDGRAHATAERLPSEPQPTLARLADLLARGTTADARLTVDGTPRPLPASIELSGYRIVEHLLQAMRDAPDAAIDVRLRFLPDAVELHASGPPSAGGDLRAVLAAAGERASLHGGTVRSRPDGGRQHAVARLPLISSHG